MDRTGATKFENPRDHIFFSGSRYSNRFFLVERYDLLHTQHNYFSAVVESSGKSEISRLGNVVRVVLQLQPSVRVRSMLTKYEVKPTAESDRTDSETDFKNLFWGIFSN